MMPYNPIYLTASEHEARDLGQSLDVLFDYLILDKKDAVPIYVRRIGDIIEIHPVQGSLESLTIVSSGKSGSQPKRMSVSCDGQSLSVTLGNSVYHVYFSADENSPES